MPIIVETHIEVEALNTTFQVNETIAKSNFIVKLFDAEHPLGVITTDYTITPNKFTRTGRQTITFRYNQAFLFASVLADVLLTFDKMYVYDKKTLVGSYFGEIQSDYNISFTLDGTKDSSQVVIYNHQEEEIKPNTIVYLESTQTWWIVEKDTSKRYNNEQNALYEHTIQLVEAFYILNKRDMINCGFNVNHYTYTQFFNRLAKMFDTEFHITFNFNNVVDGSKKVDYLKTFENYTPFSALREVADGLNAVCKMDFVVDANNTITSAVIDLVSKSGNANAVIEDSYFANAEQTITSSNNNYGTRVVSNVQNCVSASEVRYPALGGVKLSSEDNKIDYHAGGAGSEITNNCVVRLPSAVYKMIKMDIRLRIRIQTINDSEEVIAGKDIYAFDGAESALSDLQDYLNNYQYTMTQEDIASARNVINTGIIEIKNGGYWENDGNGGDLWFGDVKEISGQKYMLNDKMHYETSKALQRTIYWEQGSNLVKNFDFISLPITATSYTFYVSTTLRVSILTSETTNIGLSGRYAFVYIPMNNLKLKIDNSCEENDSLLYNQNGKLVDSSAVSKLINEHAKDISSNEIMRSKNYYDYWETLDIGQRVRHNNEIYVINNVSLDFVQNDFYGYFIYAQYTMTKDSACKSTMISANSNIRDYDCPQKNNIERIQTYRDYIELGYTLYSQVATYLGLDNIFNFTSSSAGLNNNYTAFIKVVDPTFVNAQTNPNGNYFYVLGTTRYELNKTTIIQLDFKDNNIIGYESSNSYKLITPSNLLSLSGSSINTPISYVNSYGEIKEIDFALLNETKVKTIYGLNETAFGGSVSLPSAYYTSALNNNDVLIQEPNYDKDGLEIPIFEYCVQVGNANGIVFGNKFLSSFKASSFTYKYRIMPTEINENNAYLVSGNNCTFTKVGRQLQINFSGNDTDLYGKNIGIFVVYTNEDNQVVRELLFAINNCQAHATTDLTLYINSYKLK